MKIFLIITMVFTSFTSGAHAGGCGTRNPDGSVEKCLPAGMLSLAAVSPEEADRLRVRLRNLGTEGYLSHCKVLSGAQVKEISGAFCGAGNVSPRVCTYKLTLDCTLDGRSFEVEAAGACQGGLHDCGTFASCARDNDTHSRTGGFRGDNDVVPKEFKLNNGSNAEKP